ncbi:hypothetical protein ACOSP7_014649 [Xanthoceras sorbifolium]
MLLKLMNLKLAAILLTAAEEQPEDSFFITLMTSLKDIDVDSTSILQAQASSKLVKLQHSSPPTDNGNKSRCPAAGDE